MTTVVVTAVAGIIVLALTFTASQIVTGQLNAADVLHRLPTPIAALFVDDRDASMRLDCDGLDEHDLDAVVAYTRERDLALAFHPPDQRPESIAWVEWVVWRDLLVVHDGPAIPAEHLGATGCPG